MEEQQLDHWRQLAEELGAEVPAEDPQQLAAIEGKADSSHADLGLNEPGESPTPAATKAPLPPRPTPPRKTPSDWARVAEELGIEVPPEPEPAPVAKATVAVEDQRTPRPDELQPGLELKPEADRPRDDLRPAPHEFDQEKSRIGRTRPRRRRSDESREDRSKTVATDEPFEKESDNFFGDEELLLPEVEPVDSVDEEIEDIDDESKMASSATAEPPAARGDDVPRRGKRRRRRKSGTPRPDSSFAQRDAKQSASEPREGVVPVPSDRADTEAPDDDFGTELDDEDEESASAKPLHRAIPSWFEAVNLVVSANLESRAKNPDRRSSGRSRGGHDRRGRDRSNS